MALEKPEIDFPDGAAARRPGDHRHLEGDGAEATAGHNVTVHYVGVAHSTGEEFDASLEPRRPVPVPARRGPGHRGLGPGRAGHEGRRPPRS